MNHLSNESIESIKPKKFTFSITVESEDLFNAEAMVEDIVMQAIEVRGECVQIFDVKEVV